MQQSEKGTKEQLIIEAAQRRFGVYGVEKTSMREIADDLNLSKASLYYYFPDKESLYKAVVELEQAVFIDSIKKEMKRISDADRLLKQYAVSRLSYFRTLLNLSRLRMQSYPEFRPLLKDTLHSFREREKEIVASIIGRGVSDGIFFYKGTDAAASLFLDMLKGLRLAAISDRVYMGLDQQEYEFILEKTNAMTDIFIKGLKYKQSDL